MSGLILSWDADSTPVYWMAKLTTTGGNKGMITNTAAPPSEELNRAISAIRSFVRRKSAGRARLRTVAKNTSGPVTNDRP
jgi:hypothetical protein